MKSLKWQTDEPLKLQFHVIIKLTFSRGKKLWAGSLAGGWGVQARKRVVKVSIEAPPSGRRPESDRGSRAGPAGPLGIASGGDTWGIASAGAALYEFSFVFKGCI